MGHYKSIVFGLSLLITCCAHQPNFAHQINAAKHRWYAAVCLIPEYKYVRMVDSITECGKPDPNLSPLVPPEWWGCITYETGEIQVSAKVPYEYRQQVLAHEMGHALRWGGGHVGNGKGILSASVDLALPHITQADIDLVCKEQHCPCQRPETP